MGKRSQNTDRCSNTMAEQQTGNVVQHPLGHIGLWDMSSNPYFSFQDLLIKSFIASDQLFPIVIRHFSKRSSLLNDESMCCYPTVTVVVIITKVKVKKHFVCLN